MTEFTRPKADMCAAVLFENFTISECFATLGVSVVEKKIDELTIENAKLREALERIARRVPIMGSEGDYRSGQLHALEACFEVARIALKT